jgi:long-chain acyl-CoA synthetase
MTQSEIACGPPYRPLSELLAQHARNTPDKAALVDVELGTSISFAQLALVVDSVAVQLDALGVSHGSRVLLLADQGMEKLLLWFALWRLGAVVCPLDLAFLGTSGAARTLAAIAPALVLRNAANQGKPLPVAIEARQVMCSAWPDGNGAVAQRLAAASQTDPQDAMIDFTLPDRAWLAKRLAELAWPAVAATDLACMGATSGTSGHPRVIVYDHGCYWLNGLASVDLVGFGAADHALEYRSFGWYSAQILSLMPFLLTGLSLHLAPQFSRSRFYDWISRYRITVCAGVPTVINMLLSAPPNPPGDTLVDLSTLRVMTCSTAPLSTLQWLHFEQSVGIRLLNLYGSSEAGWICGNRSERRRIGTVGYPAKYAQFAILNATGQACEVGELGQVTVSGAKLALGELQADGSLAPIRGTQFHTRDLASMDADGFVHIVGRTDDMIIRGGLKIGPQEIEEVLLAHERIVDAAAIGVPDPIYGQEIVCFVVSALPGALDEASILEYCAHHLPREKCPRRVFMVASLPRSARDKVRRDALRQEWWSAVQVRHELDDDSIHGD